MQLRGNFTRHLSQSFHFFWGGTGHDGPSLVEAVRLSPQDATLGGAKQQLKIRWVHHHLGCRGDLSDTSHDEQFQLT